MLSQNGTPEIWLTTTVVRIRFTNSFLYVCPVLGALYYLILQKPYESGVFKSSIL